VSARTPLAARLLTVAACAALAATPSASASPSSSGGPKTPSRATALCGPGDNPEPGMQGETPLADLEAGRTAAPYVCGMRIVGKLDPWGRGDNAMLKRSRQCAYVYGGGERKGIAVIDASDPKAPKAVGLLDTPGAIGGSETMDVIDTGTRHLLVAGDYSGGLRPPGPAPLDIYDISDCTRPKLLTTFYWPANIHVPKISPDGMRVYASREYGTDGLMVLDISDPAKPVYMGEYPLVLPGGKAQRCHDMWINDGQTRLICAGSVPMIEARKGDSAPSIWDITQIGKSNPEWPTIRFVGTSDIRGQGDHHAPLLRVRGRQYLVAANELRCTAFPRIFDMTDEKSLRMVGEFRLEANDRCLDDPAWAKANAAGSYGLHYNAVVDDAWGGVALGLFSFMGSGVRVVDLRDPTHPYEVAYYHPGAIDAPSPPGPLAGKTDSCMSINSFVPETGHIWFVCRSGFYVAELSKAVRAKLGASVL